MLGTRCPGFSWWRGAVPVLQAPSAWHAAKSLGSRRTQLLSISHICLHRHFRHRGATPATEGGENPPEIQVFKHQRGANPVSRPFWRPRTRACCVLTLLCTVRAQNRETDRSKEIRLVFRNHVLSRSPTTSILGAMYIYRRKLDVTKERVLIGGSNPSHVHLRTH